MSENNGSIKWAASPDVKTTFSEDGAVLLDIEKGILYSLNPVGANIWKMVVSDPFRSTTIDLVEMLCLQFQIPQEQLKTDVDSYLQDLLEKGLLFTNANGHQLRQHQS